MGDNMTDETVLQEILDFLKLHDTEITGINFGEGLVPEFCLLIKKDKKSEEDINILLKEFYKVFWVLSYGKPNDKNKDNQIKIDYKLV